MRWTRTFDCRYGAFIGAILDTIVITDSLSTTSDRYQCPFANSTQIYTPQMDSEIISIPLMRQMRTTLFQAGVGQFSVDTATAFKCLLGHRSNPFTAGQGLELSSSSEVIEAV